MEPTGTAENESKPLEAVIQIDDGKIQARLDRVVRATVEETLDALLDAEDDWLRGAKCYTNGRKLVKMRGRATTNGRCTRDLNQKIYRQIKGWRQRPLERLGAGEVTLKVPKCAVCLLKPRYIERYRHRESSV